MNLRLDLLGERVSMKHGAGGRAMRQLIGEVFTDGFPKAPSGAVGLDAMDDGAALPLGDGRFLVVTTDSHVVLPAFFPGGDIGRLAVSGTVNDLAMMGATEPLGLTCAVVVEEGYPRADLDRIHASMVAACVEAGTTVVTGDTKVMGKGQLDGVALNTTGVAIATRVVRDCGLQPGDRLIVTGTIGDHGCAVMAARHKLDLAGDLRSDVAPISLGLIRVALAAGEGLVTPRPDPRRAVLRAARDGAQERRRACCSRRDRGAP